MDVFGCSAMVKDSRASYPCSLRRESRGEYGRQSD